MDQYMETNGFIWDSKKSNYVSNLIQKKHTKSVEVVEEKRSDIIPSGVDLPSSDRDAEKLLKYLPLLEMLDKNRDRLLDLLVPSLSGIVPKYAVPGRPKTKSIYMSDLLARLIGEYCETKNLSQRDVVEASVVEFMKRNGFELEIEKLLSKK